MKIQNQSAKLNRKTAFTFKKSIAQKAAASTLDTTATIHTGTTGRAM